ncbi:MAG TPA: hypothetical protein VFL47_13325 [Flavisolibacter sp.]|nr:hypothetical protein [Flavisolibacter sp.]
MRKLFAILLLCCLLFVTAGYHLLYYFRIAEAKREMRTHLRYATNPDITTFRLSETEAAQLAWEDETEFFYEGDMYDVLSLNQEKDKVVIRCVSDQKETALAEHYLKTQKQSPAHSSGAILKLLNAPFLPSQPEFFSTLKEAIAPVNQKPFFTWQNADKPILTPPPKDC